MVSEIVHFPASRDLAELVSKTAELIFSNRGKVESSKVTGNEDFGYSITITMTDLFPVNGYITPTVIDGVPINVVIRGMQSPADTLFTHKE